MCAEIEYLDDVLYSSGSRLHRNYILFDARGNERSVSRGNAYLFAPECCAVDFSDYESVLQEDYPGQLYSMNLSEVGAVTADGVELFADEQRAKTVRLYPSVRPVRGVSVLWKGKQCLVFNKAFSLAVHFPKNVNPLRYRILIDGTQYAPEEDEGEGFRFAVDETPGRVHTVRIVELAQELIVQEFCYLLLPGFTYSLDQVRYLETEAEAAVVCRFPEGESKFTLTRTENRDTAVALSAYGGFDFDFELPTVHCSFGGMSAFSLPPRLWKGNVDKSTLLDLDLPSGWQGRLMLGVEELQLSANGCCEIGNILQSKASNMTEESFWIRLRRPEGSTEKIQLTRFVFTPCFDGVPLDTDGETLIWSPEEIFLGDSRSRFRVCLTGNAEREFELGLEERVLCPAGDLPHGRYQCRVFLKAGGLFSRGEETLLLSTELTIGNENELRFESRELYLQNAVYWNFETDQMELQPMRTGAAILTRLRYIGFGTPSGESIALPEFEAELMFETSDGGRTSFSWQKMNPQYEWINPAHVWIVSNRRIVLRTVTDDALYFDAAYGTLLYRNPDYVMNRKEQRARLKNPDYFEYEIRGEHIV